LARSVDPAGRWNSYECWRICIGGIAAVTLVLQHLKTRTGSLTRLEGEVKSLIEITAPGLFTEIV
jgi:hypothetical protein